jgi:signal transduction histidine kinase/ligand-binding sensor domain-containing protein/DNA-binding response OmpR family regulator
MYRYTLFITIFLLGFCNIAIAQEHNLKHFDINNGLSNNSVVTIFQDADEFMWFGTYDGLNRFDGHAFKVYRNIIGDATSLSGNTVYSIGSDGKDNILVGGSRGACKLLKDTDTFEPLYFKSNATGRTAPISDIVHQIKKIQGGRVFISTQQNGLIYYATHNKPGQQVALQIGGKKIYHYDAEAVEYVIGTTYCWVLVRDVGICKLDFGTMQLSVFYNTAQRLYSLVSDIRDKNKLLLGAESGLFVLDTKAKKLSGNKMPSRSIVTNIIHDKTGRLWIATDGVGIFYLDKNADMAVPYTKSGKAISTSNSFFNVFEDSRGNLWFGSLRAGISLLDNDKQRFTRIQSGNATTPENFVLSFCEADNNNLWIGTDGFGLKYWNRKNNTFKNYKAGEGSNSLSSNFITGITKGNTDELWISAWYGGVNRLNTATGNIDHFECYNPVTKQVEKNIWFVFKDRDNTIWASATNEGTLYRFDRLKNAFTLFNNTIHNLQCLTQTKDGRLWGGDYSALIAIESKTKAVKKYNLGYPVRGILEDHEGNLWVGTQDGGLLLFDRATGKYKRFTTTDGLPGNTVLRILEDKAGNLWLSTYNGLSRFDKKSIFRNFSVSDGLQSSQFSFNAGLKMSSGEMVFGGIDGFNIFIPEKITDTPEKRNVKLNGIWLNNKPLTDNFINKDAAAGLRGLELPYDQTSVSFEFVSPDYIHPDRINYAYKMEGWDDHWNYIDNLRKANYSRLQEGDYTFMVRIKNDEGTWDKPVALASVRVLPPWYRSVWAYLIYLGVAVTGVFSYMRYNRNKMQMRYKVKVAQIESRKEKELAEKQQEMFTYISHEFRTPLSLIINPLKNAVKKPIDQNPGLPDDLAIAHRNARRLLSLVDQLLLFRQAESNADSLKISAIDLNHMANEVYQCFVNQAREQGIEYILDVSEKPIEVFGDYEKIEIAVFNLTTNAFKHTKAGGKITIAVFQDADTASISVGDTGCGISSEDLPFIFEKFRRVNSKPVSGSGFGIGLFVVKHFLEKHQGNIACTSVKDEGSTFTINLLKGYDHFADMPITSIGSKMTELVEELLGDTLKDEELQAIENIPVIEKEIVTDKKSVLIVEDNVEMRGYLANLFNTNYVVYTADNGKSGYDTAKAKRPDIIISDISMDGMDGLELCRAIKDTPELNHLPVILLTATSSPEIHLKGISEGADDYITKPFDSDLLLARVQSLLKTRTSLKSYFLDTITLKDNGSKVPAEYKDFLDKCNEIIEANIDNSDFSVKIFAQEMGMSHRTLYDKIKQITGQTTNAFIRSIRLRKAALLMLTEDKSIAQISSLVGFDDQRYFREQFVKLFNMTPSDFKRRYKNTFNKELNLIRQD